MKVQAKHGKVTQNMHGASRNYRYVWDVSLMRLKNWHSGGSLAAATPRGIIRLRNLKIGTRGLARSSHPPRHYSLTRLENWHSGAHSQQPPPEVLLAYAT